MTRRPVVRQLTAADAQFLSREDGLQSGNVAILLTLAPAPDGGVLGLEDVRDRVAARLPQIPPFRWQLHRVPLELDHPYWVEAPDVDVAHHVRETQLPPLSDAEAVAAHVAREVVRPMDRSRPLWEVHLMHGLPDGETGVLLKFHHASMDGESAVEVIRLLVDGPSRRVGPPAVAGPARRSSDVRMAGHGVFHCVARLMRLPEHRRADLGIRAHAKGSQPEAGPQPVVDGTAIPPTTGFNGSPSAGRAFAYGRLPVSKIREIRRRHGFTTNDVVVAIYAGAVRRWLLAHDELVRSPLVTMLPLSTRANDRRMVFGNHFYCVLAPFHTEEIDPIERLRLTHDSLRFTRDPGEALSDRYQSDLDARIIPPILDRARQTLRRRAVPTADRKNLIVSTVPGPPLPVRFAGAVVTGIYPCSIVLDGVGLNITSIVYGGHAHYGIAADEGQVPDAWRVADWIQESFDELATDGAIRPADV
jgi:diacylglycerol O-acyltransferase